MRLNTFMSTAAREKGQKKRICTHRSDQIRTGSENIAVAPSLARLLKGEVVLLSSSQVALRELGMKPLIPI